MSQQSVEAAFLARLRCGMGNNPGGRIKGDDLKRVEEAERKALGERLRSIRVSRGHTLESVAKHLSGECEIPATKASVGHWETGARMPSVLVIRKLAKLYGVTTDSMLWDDGLSMEAVRFAVQFDALSDSDQRKFRAMWMAFFEQAKTDEEVASHLPAPPPMPEPSEPVPKPDRIGHTTIRSANR